jgi:hypothetical protein
VLPLSDAFWVPCTFLDELGSLVNRGLGCRGGRRDLPPSHRPCHHGEEGLVRVRHEVVTVHSESCGTHRHGRAADSGRFHHRAFAFSSVCLLSSVIGGGCRRDETPLFGDRDRDGCAAGLAFVNIEKPATAHRHPLFLAQMLPELRKHAWDSQRSLFPKDAAVANEFVLPAL